MSGLVKRFVDSFLERSPLPLVAYLTESSELTAEQAAELRKLVDRWESQSEGKS
jgi:predicted transcriptional regulator